mmetsp:Transcript_22298/g.44679  ORF Transcript_22298/g.44679 Transcript_22298/m.44679 type:complete len:278 (-) Transcript_22298:191-1024(-)
MDFRSSVVGRCSKVFVDPLRLFAYTFGNGEGACFCQYVKTYAAISLDGFSIDRDRLVRYTIAAAAATLPLQVWLPFFTIDPVVPTASFRPKWECWSRLLKDTAVNLSIQLDGFIRVRSESFVGSKLYGNVSVLPQEGTLVYPRIRNKTRSRVTSGASATARRKVLNNRRGAIKNAPDVTFGIAAEAFVRAHGHNTSAEATQFPITTAKVGAFSLWVAAAAAFLPPEVHRSKFMVGASARPVFQITSRSVVGAIRLHTFDIGVSIDTFVDTVDVPPSV